MILIIADKADLPAHWLGAAMRQRFPHAVEVVSPAQLAYAPAIIHELASERSRSRFRLWSGRELDFTEVRGVINRITALPTAHLERADLADRDYAAGELHAFLLGWLSSLECPVLNPPAPEWLAGVSHGDISALHLATQAGLRCPAATIDTANEPALSSAVGQGAPEAAAVHFILDGQLVGPMLHRRERDALISFAAAWGARLLQVETAEVEGGRLFLRATSLPDYRFGGGALVRAIAGVLGG